MTKPLFRIKLALLLPVLLFLIVLLAVIEGWEGFGLYARISVKERWPDVRRLIRALRAGERCP